MAKANGLRWLVHVMRMEGDNSWGESATVHSIWSKNVRTTKEDMEGAGGGGA